MPRGDSFTRSISPYIQNSASMISNMLLQKSAEERERQRQADALNKLAQAFGKATGRIDEISTGVDPNDSTILPGEKYTQTMNLPVPKTQGYTETGEPELINNVARLKFLNDQIRDQRGITENIPNTSDRRIRPSDQPDNPYQTSVSNWLRTLPTNPRAIVQGNNQPLEKGQGNNYSQLPVKNVEELPAIPQGAQTPDVRRGGKTTSEYTYLPRETREPDNALPYRSIYDIMGNISPEMLQNLSSMNTTDENTLGTNNQGRKATVPFNRPAVDTGSNETPDYMLSDVAPADPNNDITKMQKSYSYEEQLPGDIMLGDYLPEAERYKHARQATNEFMSEGILNQDVDVNQLNALADLLSQETARMKPKSLDIKEIDPTKAAGYYDDEGIWHETRAAKDKPKTFDIEGNFDNDKTGTTWTFDKQTGQFIDTKIPFERKKGKGDGKENEKGLKDTTSKLIANLKNIDPYQRDSKTGEYLTDAKSNKIPKTPEDIKYEKDLTMENIKLQLLSPRTYEWMGNIEKLWGKDYLSPKELKDEAIKHAKSGGLTEAEQDDIAKYLKYYISIYPGLTK